MKVRRKIEVAIIFIFSLAASMSVSASDSDFIMKGLQKDDREVRLLDGAAPEGMNNLQSTDFPYPFVG